MTAISDKVVNSDSLDNNNCLDNKFENPIHFTDSERRVLKSRNKHINEQKEHCNAIIYENKNDGVGKNEVSCSIQSSNNINYGKLKLNTIVSVLGKDSKESTDDENSKCTTKKTENMKTSDMSNDFTVWGDFIDLSGGVSFNVGEEMPYSKLLPGSCFKTPETSPSHSIFQITTCNSEEVLQYVQLKTKNDKAVKKKNAEFIHTSTEYQAVNDVYAALLKGEPITKHVILKSMNVVSDSSSEYLD